MLRRGELQVQVKVRIRGRLLAREAGVAESLFQAEARGRGKLSWIMIVASTFSWAILADVHL